MNQPPPPKRPRYEERDIGPRSSRPPRPPRAEKRESLEQKFYADLTGKSVQILFRGGVQRISGTLVWSTDHAIGVRLKADDDVVEQVVLVMKGDIRSISP